MVRGDSFNADDADVADVSHGSGNAQENGCPEPDALLGRLKKSTKAVVNGAGHPLSYTAVKLEAHCFLKRMKARQRRLKGDLRLMRSMLRISFSELPLIRMQIEDFLKKWSRAERRARKKAANGQAKKRLRQTKSRVPPPEPV